MELIKLMSNGDAVNLQCNAWVLIMSDNSILENTSKYNPLYKI